MPTDKPLGQQHPTSTNRDVIGKGVGRSLGFATKAWYSTLNLARWAILAGILVFLLTAILALHEALNFQDRVVELAGDDRDRARRVLSVLHDTLKNPGDYVEERNAPFASIAVALDRLDKAQRDLQRFEIKEVTTTVTNDPPSGNVPDGKETPELNVNHQPVQTAGLEKLKEDGSPSKRNAEVADSNVSVTEIAEEFKASLDRLKVSIADLDKTIESGDPDRRLVAALIEAKQDIESMKAFEGGPLIAEDAKPPAKGSVLAADTEVEQAAVAQYQLQKAVEDLASDLQRVEDNTKTQPSARLLAFKMESLHRRVANLNDFLDVPLTIKKAATIPVRSHDKPTSTVDALKAIEREIESLRSTLTESDPGFVAANKLATLINQSRHLSSTLTKIEATNVAYRHPETNTVETGTKAQAMFDTVRGDISKTVQKIEDQLKTQTRVIAVAEQLDLDQLENTDGRNRLAAAILRDFDAVGRFEATLMPLSRLADNEALSWISGFGFEPQEISTLHRETLALIFVFVIGAIGSVIYITRYSIQLVLEGNWLTDQPKRSLAWYLFRPVFGVVVALAAFLLFKAGQLALGNNGVLDGSGEFNLPILSVIALFAGLLSWQALEAIETRGDSWFRSQKRQYLWATGLENGLRAEPHSRDELASSIGRSRDQVFRWLVLRDRVSPEMQDRIAGWLNVPPNHLFGNDEPQRNTLWLKVAKPVRKGIEASVFREELGDGHFHKEKLDAWIDEGKPVPPMAQDRIILVMGRLMSEVFTDEAPSSAPASPPSTEPVEEEETPSA